MGAQKFACPNNFSDKGWYQSGAHILSAEKPSYKMPLYCSRAPVPRVFADFCYPRRLQPSPSLTKWQEKLNESKSINAHSIDCSWTSLSGGLWKAAYFCFQPPVEALSWCVKPVYLLGLPRKRDQSSQSTVQPSSWSRTGAAASLTSQLWSRSHNREEARTFASIQKGLLSSPFWLNQALHTGKSFLLQVP